MPITLQTTRVTYRRVLRPYGVMAKLWLNVSLGLTCVLAWGQGGQGGVGGGQGGGRQSEYDRSVSGIERAISTYSLGDEIKNILTPGEYSEWNLNLKAGQIVVGEARSDAFDPALEIVDTKGKVLASNDDRYPGDQRPLLVWRCEVEGAYMIRARCFRDKAGGQFLIKFNMFHSMDLAGGQMVERDFPIDGQILFMFRIPMKAGQVKVIHVERPSNRHMGATLRQQISPIGLPNVDIAGEIALIAGDPRAFARGNNLIMAPVDGDYYILADAWGANPGKLRAAAVDLVPSPLVAPVRAPTDTASLWSLAVKAGEFIELSTPELHVQSRLEIGEEQDLSKFNLDKPETNPFYPRLKNADAEKGPAFVEMPGRANDPRVKVILVKRDAKLLIGSNGAGMDNTQYTLNLKPAARAFNRALPLTGKLRIGGTDYWEFSAKVGDVMTFNSGAEGFAQEIQMLDPELNQAWQYGAQVDQLKVDWNYVVRKPGRYLVAVSCLGGGGGGNYSLARNEIGAREFGKGTPAVGQISEGEVQVWKFTARPNEPLYVHWTGKLATTILDDRGAAATIGLVGIDPTNHYGILKVDAPKTILIVFVGSGPKTAYTIDLRDLPK